MTQHAGLDADRWSRFDLDQHVLMIGNEMNRASRFTLTEGQTTSLRLGYERILRLTDLTVACGPRAAVRRELLRWRDLVAALYLADTPDPDQHRAAFRALLQLRPMTARQIPLLFAERPGGPRPIGSSSSKQKRAFSFLSRPGSGE